MWRSGILAGVLALGLGCDDGGSGDGTRPEAEVDRSVADARPTDAALGDADAAADPVDTGVADAAPADAVPPDAAPEAVPACAPDGPPLPALADLRRLIVLADGAAENPSHAASHVSLLARNDDARFPAFAGLDLATRAPEVALLRLTSGGASVRGLARAPALMCELGGGCPDPADDRPTVLVVQLGADDLIALLFSYAAGGGDVEESLVAFASDVRRLLAVVDDPAFFTRRPALVVVNLPDPTDGTGRIDPALFGGQPVADLLPPEVFLRFLGAANDALRAETERCGGVLVDAHAHFLGHGFESHDLLGPHFDAADPTRWLQGLTEPGLRGAHELRRLLWRALAGDAPGDVPAGVPEEDLPGVLPPVPPEGWADAVVASAVSASTAGPRGPVPNVAADPERALGPPGLGADDAVALGVLGAWLVLDLGAGQEAVDGPGPDLVVMEAGPRSGGAPEPYRVLVSEGPEGPFVRLGDGAGERAFDLAGSGLDRARYVRLESLRFEVDLATSPGSVLYPGPEIDAVGAVHLPADE